MLRMIEAKVPGLYIFHRAEEIGCQGSGYIAKYTPEVLDGIRHVISFDRKGNDSIVTHQIGRQTASDEFARDLAKYLPIGYGADNGGVYTDSNEYRALVSECTNLSVGYYHQHSQDEYQSIKEVEILIRHLIRTPWDNVGAYRTPSLGYSKYFGNYKYPTSATSSARVDCAYCWSEIDTEYDSYGYCDNEVVCDGCTRYLENEGFVIVRESPVSNWSWGDDKMVKKGTKKAKTQDYYDSVLKNIGYGEDSKPQLKLLKRSEASENLEQLEAWEDDVDWNKEIPF